MIIKKWLNCGVVGVVALLLVAGFKNSTFATNVPVSSEANSNEVEFESGVSKEMVERFHKNFSFCNDGNLDYDADIMFDKVKAFLEGASNVSEENFFNYEVDYLKNNCSKTNQQKIRVENSDWFKQNENNDEYLPVYRGLPKKEFAESLRRGEVFIGGKCNDSFAFNLSNGIFTAPSFKHAKGFTYSVVETKNDDGEVGFGEQQTGEVVKLALHKNIKLIHRDYLEKIVKRMIEKNSDYFKDYLQLLEQYGDLGGPELSILGSSPWFYDFKYLAEFVKANTGYDYYEVVGTKPAKDCMHELREKYANLFGAELSIREDGVEEISILPDDECTSEQKLKRVEYGKFIKENDVEKKGWCVSKEQALLKNDGLLTKFMGYDGYTICPIDGDDTPESIRKESPIGGQFVIVDVDNLVVCSDVFYDSSKDKC